MTTPLDAIPVLVPLLNPNEPEARLVNLSVQEGDYVKHGIVLCTLETTKSTVELEAESDGYIRGLRFEEGGLAGEVLCYLATCEWQPPVGRQNQTKVIQTPIGRAYSCRSADHPALDLALQTGVDSRAAPPGHWSPPYHPGPALF
jgi:pyruvate/2-oxoglutarate dehydrogenase complex dihydrolipoamide acyltransferase (E2) component